MYIGGERSVGVCVCVMLFVGQVFFYIFDDMFVSVIGRISVSR